MSEIRDFLGLKTLTGRLALFFLAALAGTAILFSVVERVVHSSLIQRETSKQFRHLARQTLASMLYAMRQEPPGSIEEVLTLAVADQGVRRIEVLDTAGTVRHSSDRSRIGTRSAFFPARGIPADREPLVMESTPSGSRATIIEPIDDEERCHKCHGTGGAKGVFEVELDTTEMVAGFDHARWWLRISVGVAMAITLSLLWLLLRRFLIGPVEVLLSSMRRVGSGDLSARVELHTPREFRELGVQFNAMVERLEVAKEALERYYQESLTRAGQLASVGELAATMAHEIQNPLAGISGALQVLRRDPRIQHRREIVDELLLNVERLSKTAQDLLDFARPPVSRFEECDVNRCVRSVIELLRPDPTASAAFEVVEDLDPRLPPIWSDPRQLRQVLLNVCLNAVQAIPPGGRIEVRTRTRGEPEVSSVLVSIADHGVGIPAEDLEKIFQPFFTTKHRGTGLGLSITRSILERHGGRIAVESRRGEGTRVEIEVPLRPPPEAGVRGEDLAGAGKERGGV